MNDDIALRGDRKRNVAAAGGVIGAVLASSCCLGPLVLITLGVSGAWIGNLTALKVYQPIFVIVALLFIGFGFWQVYGKAKQDCADGSYCATPASNLIIKSALWIATLLVALALTIDLWAPLFFKERIMRGYLPVLAVLALVGFAASSLSADPYNETTVIFAVEKMTCATCPISVRKAMERVDGVREVKVDFDSKTATVTFDSSMATASDIGNASTNVGFPASVLEDQ